MPVRHPVRTCRPPDRKGGRHDICIAGVLLFSCNSSHRRRASRTGEKTTATQKRKRSIQTHASFLYSTAVFVTHMHKDKSLIINKHRNFFFGIRKMITHLYMIKRNKIYIDDKKRGRLGKKREKEKDKKKRDLSLFSCLQLNDQTTWHAKKRALASRDGQDAKGRSLAPCLQPHRTKAGNTCWTRSGSSRAKGHDHVEPTATLPPNFESAGAMPLMGGNNVRGEAMREAETWEDGLPQI